ncbi:MAG: polyphosphate kinase 2 family protein [Acidimicrobiales bacterium]
MKLPETVIEELKVRPGSSAGLDRRSTESTTVDWLGGSGSSPKHMAEEDLQSFVEELKGSQELLWASDRYALLVVIQAMDAAGKDGTIKHVMSGVNPQGCQVTAFKEPSSEELAHDFLWRYSKALPLRGRIGIFNRSYYEEVLVVRVHPELLTPALGSSDGKVPASLWKKRYEDVNAFEHHLHRNGTRIVKVFLHVSKEEQKRRFLDRLEDPAKYWKFSPADLAERRHWSDYQSAYEEALTATSTEWAPWFVVPADHKHTMRALVGGILVYVVDGMDLQLPQVGPDGLQALAEAKDQLLAE